MIKDMCKGPLLVEIKDFEDISKPKQRFEDDKSKDVDVSLNYQQPYFIIARRWA